MALQWMGSTVFDDNVEAPDTKWVDVQIRDIVDAWQALELGRVDLMKINIEGAEFPLLERMADAGLLEQVDTFLIQFHEWHPGAYHRRRKIRRALATTHTLEWDYHFIWEKWVRKPAPGS